MAGWKFGSSGPTMTSTKSTDLATALPRGAGTEVGIVGKRGQHHSGEPRRNLKFWRNVYTRGGSSDVVEFGLQCLRFGTFLMTFTAAAVLAIRRGYIPLGKECAPPTHAS